MDFFDDDDNYEQDFGRSEPTYEAEIGAFERVGPGRMNLALTLIQGGKFGDLQRKLKEFTSPEDRFKIYVDAISRKLSHDDIIHVSEADINSMIESSENVNELKFKNPMGYILGFLATDGGRHMNRERIVKIINSLPRIPEDIRRGVEPPDVVRYARFWNRLT